MINHSDGVVDAALKVLSAWQTVKIHHGELSVGDRDACRRICREIALEASRSGQPLEYSFSQLRIEFTIGPPDSFSLAENLLFALKPYVNEQWLILRV